MVFGLREVRRGVRAQQVKCLIVAPNVSDGEELQRQITEILDGAAAAKIPVAFALGKRRLGKALRKQSCSVLAIYSDDGAVDEYRAVIKRLDEILLDPSKAIPPGEPLAAASMASARALTTLRPSSKERAPPKTSAADTSPTKRNNARERPPRARETVTLSAVVVCDGRQWIVIEPSAHARVPIG